MKSPLSSCLVCFLLFFAACQDQRQVVATPSPSPTVAAASKSSPVDLWVGRWAGVEGTSLDLAKNGDRWTVRVADLDGVKTYEGVAVADHLEFKRGDKTETIRPTDGEGTGMKWLTEEKNCLVITVGSEGYCRK
jgi:hypothetical protein